MKRGIINKLIGCTDAHLRAQVRSALRKVWRNSSRRCFVESVRRPNVEGLGRFKYVVDCVGCGRVMGQSEKEFVTLKSGAQSKKKKLCYETDHITGNPEFTDIKRDLGNYADSLLYGDMRILCRKCHAEVTLQQTKDRSLKES